MNAGEKSFPLTPAPFPQSQSQCHKCSAISLNGTGGGGGLTVPRPRPSTRPHQGNMRSGFAPTHKHRPAFQSPSCIYPPNLRGEGSEGNRIESVTGCKKLKNPLLLLLLRLWRPELKRENEISVLKPALIRVMARHRLYEPEGSREC